MRVVASVNKFDRQDGKNNFYIINEVYLKL